MISCSGNSAYGGEPARRAAPPAAPPDLLASEFERSPSASSSSRRRPPCSPLELDAIVDSRRMADSAPAERGEGASRLFARTAVLLIGYQNDYFASDGILRHVVELSCNSVLERTVNLVSRLVDTSVLLVATPIVFTPNYSELLDPTGILKVIRDGGAFRSGSPGSRMVHELAQFGSRITVVPGKRGLNAFTGTSLEVLLRREGVTDVVVCGAVTSTCIDSTGRAAHERGFRVHHVSDLTCGRTALEQEHYVSDIFPLYAEVSTADAVVERILTAEHGKHWEPQRPNASHYVGSDVQGLPEAPGQLDPGCTVVHVTPPPMILPAAIPSPATRRKAARSAPGSELPAFARTAVILIGYQNDYFAQSGALRSVVESSCERVLANTVQMLNELAGLDEVLLIATPMILGSDCSELVEPRGILKVFCDSQAFCAGTSGAELVPELRALGSRLKVLPGKRGLNAFTGTTLDSELRTAGVTDVVICGAVTGVCIDSTGRSAHDRGFHVHIVEDCTCGRTEFEQQRYVSEIFPLYAHSVAPATEISDRILASHHARRTDGVLLGNLHLDVDKPGRLAPLPLGSRTSSPENSSVGCARTSHRTSIASSPSSASREFARSAVIFIGYQNDYFARDGILNHVIESSSAAVLSRTLELIQRLQDTSVLMVQTPIVFTPDYSELVEPSGILKAIRDAGAFRSGWPGSETIPQLTQFGRRILTVPGKRGLNAFTGTLLESILRQEGVTDIVLCGAVTSVCIDSTGRAAHERGFRVHHLRDCSCGRTDIEQQHYTEEIFPLYASVRTVDEVVECILAAESRPASASGFRPEGPRVHIEVPLSPKAQALMTPAITGQEAPFARTAIILVGYQNDYFSPTGVLRSVVEASCEPVLNRTLHMLSKLVDTDTLFVATPIVFTEGYTELVRPTGILKSIKDLGAFRAGTPGGLLIPELASYEDRMIILPGKRGLNAFTGTALEETLRQHRITDIVVCGALTSVCIDSTGRAAHELGFRVHILKDCTCGRTLFEQKHYTSAVFPLYARSVESAAVVTEAVLEASRRQKEETTNPCLLPSEAFEADQSSPSVGCSRSFREPSFGVLAPSPMAGNSSDGPWICPMTSDVSGVESAIGSVMDRMSSMTSGRELTMSKMASRNSHRVELTTEFQCTAVILIGYQNDYFASDGVLRSVIENSCARVLANTVRLIESLQDTSVLFVSTPIVFTSDYSELIEPSGILKAIKDAGAFCLGSPGCKTVPEITQFGSRILTVPGKRGLNAFTGTTLESVLQQAGVTDVVLCGAVTSVCVDSTGRAAHECGFRVHHLSDCSCGRTELEQQHYVSDIFPLYADVATTDEILERILAAELEKLPEHQQYWAPDALSPTNKVRKLMEVNIEGEARFIRTAVILVGFQKDYFWLEGALHKVIESSSVEVLEKTHAFLEEIRDTGTLIIATPQAFTSDYSELVQPTGMLQAIKEVGAFKVGSTGAEIVPEITRFGDRIKILPGKRGLNAFTGTNLENVLRDSKITDIVLAGAVTSVCIDSTGRAAHERGFRVHILTDCTCGRTELEQQHYASEIFPLYACSVATSDKIAEQILVADEKFGDQQASMDLPPNSGDWMRTMTEDIRLWSRCTTDSCSSTSRPPARNSDDFVSRITVEMVKEWMRRNMEKSMEIKEFQEEMNVQIQHRLIEKAAQMQRKLTHMESDSKACRPQSIRRRSKDPTDWDVAQTLAFLSHVKKEAASTARLLKLMFKRLIRKDEEIPKIFLDSDDLVQLPKLLQQVVSSEVLIVIMTHSIFSRPWIMCELCAAFKHNVPVLCIEMHGQDSGITHSLPIGPQVSRWLTQECMTIVGKNGFDRDTVVAAIEYALVSPRLPFDAEGSQSIQWAQILDVARAMPGVEIAVPDPISTFCQFEVKVSHWGVYLAYHRGVDTTTAHVVKLLLQGVLPEWSPVFLDADNLSTIQTMMDTVRNSDNVVLLLSQETLKRPYVIAEMVEAYKAGIHMVPVPITKDFDINKYVSEDFYYSLSEEFDDAAKAFFKDRKISWSDIAKSFRKLFCVIAEYFLPQSSEVVMHASIHELCRRLHVQKTFARAISCSDEDDAYGEGPMRKSKTMPG